MLRVETIERIDEVPEAEWNGLVPDNNPFLKHQFLAALERHGCVSPEFGWHPRHLVGRDGGRLVAAAPLYLKENSYGEFVFDFAWARAYQQHGLAYYPKLVSAIPYTPATGSRLLTGEGVDRSEAARVLLDAALLQAERDGASSVHWLFLFESEQALLAEMGLMSRIDVQFHWHNRGYRDFDHFLEGLTSKRRKNVRRERRRVAEAGLRLRLLHGDEVTEEAWRLFAGFYAKTFEERYSLPTLNAPFFAEVGRTLGRQVILVLAYDGDRCVAGALMFRSDKVLYGRHWGTYGDFEGLHFEACYYQGIEYAIREGIERFEPGAQGEHKIWRGFMPTLTRSSHWVANPPFARAIGDFLARERPAIVDYKETLERSSPYRSL